MSYFRTLEQYVNCKLQKAGIINFNSRTFGFILASTNLLLFTLCWFVGLNLFACACLAAVIILSTWVLLNYKIRKFNQKSLESLPEFFHSMSLYIQKGYDSNTAYKMALNDQ